MVNPIFDADGNQTQLSNSKGSWNLVYNAENRIIEMTSDTQKLEFVYDYMGRRVSKKVYQKDVTNNYQLKTNNSFIYDAYLLIEILDGANEGLKQTFTWNDAELVCTDVHESGSTKRYFYTHNANKNVSELIGSTGAVAAHYEYSPFGKVVKSTFSTPDSGLINPFRFSNEYHDDETGLVYYNYRYYNSEIGRWTKRDPIEEEGGLNLYGMLNNDTVNFEDYLGLENCKFVYKAGVHGYQMENALEEFYKDGNTPCKGMWGTGCNVFGGKQGEEKRKKYNGADYRPEGAAKFDDSFAGYGDSVNNPNGNRGFNKKEYGENWRRMNKQRKDEASRRGYRQMVENGWNALRKQAEKAAADCNCECTEIKLVFEKTGGFSKRIRNTGFNEPENETFPCEKNAKK
jgi:RHS repeat-associated protein